MKKNITCSIIVVTYESEKFIGKLVETICAQTVQPNQVIFVDTGSKDLTYLISYISHHLFSLVIGGKEIGFCKGNNIAMRHVPADTDYILYLNPDAFLFPDFLEKAIAFMENSENKNCGIVSGRVYGYDIENNLPTGNFDTTGVFRKWYGNWYDRGQGQNCCSDLYKKIEEVPAICGALMFCRKKAINSVLINKEEVFDSSFYMYKEDIDLCLRMRKKQWKLIYNPELQAYHCRGWNPNRKQMKRSVRILSAKNELMIHLKNLSPIGSCYSAIKYLGVALFNI